MLFTVLLVSCGEDGGGNPVSPLGYLDAAGTWSFAGQVTSDNCDFLSLGLARAAKEVLSVAKRGKSLRNPYSRKCLRGKLAICRHSERNFISIIGGHIVTHRKKPDCLVQATWFFSVK